MGGGPASARVAKSLRARAWQTLRGCAGTRDARRPHPHPPLRTRSLALLDFASQYDAASATWAVSVALPLGAAPQRLLVWCQDCQPAARGVVASMDLGAGSDGDVVLVLRGAQPRRQERALLAAACSTEMTVGGTAHSFDQCVDLSSTTGTTFQLLYTLQGTTLKAGIKAASQGGWAGLGFTSEPGTMVGSDAVIIAPTATGARVSSWCLPTCLPAACLHSTHAPFPPRPSPPIRRHCGGLPPGQRGRRPHQRCQGHLCAERHRRWH